MATLHEDIQAVLDSAAGAGGAWYGINTQEPPTFPFLTWLVVVSSINNTLDGATANQPARIQVDILGERVADVIGRYGAVLSALEAAGFGWLQLSYGDGAEPDLGAFRRRVDFSVWPGE